MKRAANAVAPATAVGSDCPVDLDLVTRIAVGDSAALDALYARYSSPVRALVRKILPRAEDADEVVLDVFWQVWRQADATTTRGERRRPGSSRSPGPERSTGAASGSAARIARFRSMIP